MRAYEIPATVTADGHLALSEFQLDLSLRNAQVKVLILVEEPEDIGDAQWLKAAVENPAFDFLKDPEEDIYTVNDGKPFQN
ncbi:hypothetical protein [Leptolyngbya sp. PCC 6406]|uniref:hypothetical protein n=1 Tax=Leptolyngbya sp. PCC 6406 TaxID=1173264 RepID=UPI0002AC769C|nr:hypothetical protein [Leptolyngbya sp. PCC 6406]